MEETRKALNEALKYAHRLQRALERAQEHALAEGNPDAIAAQIGTLAENAIQATFDVEDALEEIKGD